MSLNDYRALIEGLVDGDRTRISYDRSRRPGEVWIRLSLDNGVLSADAVGNEELPAEGQLTDDQEVLLMRWGWSAPHPGQYPTFFRDFPLTLGSEYIARELLTALRGPYGVDLVNDVRRISRPAPGPAPQATSPGDVLGIHLWMTGAHCVAAVAVRADGYTWVQQGLPIGHGPLWSQLVPAGADRHTLGRDTTAKIVLGGDVAGSLTALVTGFDQQAVPITVLEWPSQRSETVIAQPDNAVLSALLGVDAFSDELVLWPLIAVAVGSPVLAEMGGFDHPRVRALFGLAVPAVPIQPAVGERPKDAQAVSDEFEDLFDAAHQMPGRHFPAINFISDVVGKYRIRAQAAGNEIFLRNGKRSVALYVSDGAITFALPRGTALQVGAFPGATWTETADTVYLRAPAVPEDPEDDFTSEQSALAMHWAELALQHTSGDVPAKELVTLDDFAAAYVGQFTGTREQREYHRALTETLLALSLPGYPTFAQGDHWETHILMDFVRRSVEDNTRSTNPFSGLMEAPPSIGKLHRKRGESFQKLDAQRQQLMESFVKDALALLSPRTEISWEKVGRRGVPRQAPLTPAFDVEDW